MDAKHMGQFTRWKINRIKHALKELSALALTFLECILIDGSVLKGE